MRSSKRAKTQKTVQPAAVIASNNSQAPRRWCDGPMLKELLSAATAWLEYNVNSINALNVFPVPDGDTGTNMLLTMKAALAEIGPSVSHSAAEIAQAAAQGALMGARGNSGVILSQIMRGFARGLDAKEKFNAADLATALREASATAYKGVLKPVEGTILTVSRDAAAAGASAAMVSDDLLVVLERVAIAAKDSVARTPQLLQVLRDAGVVDAGGQGLYIILEGAVRFLRGERIEMIPSTVEEGASPAFDVSRLEQAGGYGYCTEFVLQGQNLDFERVRAEISAMGESAIVVGDEYLIRVHIHTHHPGQVLEYATGKGILRKIKIDNMQDQHREFLGLSLPVEPPATPKKSPAAVEQLSDLGVVVVSPGPGFSRVFESLGASAIVPGGQTMNPSTEELLRAIDSLATDNVIVLPNNKNILLAARQAQELTKKNVVVVPTRTVPQGIAALLALNYQADLQTNARNMERAMSKIQTAEITQSVRAAEIGGIQVAEGSVIGLLNGDLTASGPDIESVALKVLDQMSAANGEIITVYYGADVSEDQANSLADRIRQAYPDQEVEVVNGGQPYYYYILSAE